MSPLAGPLRLSLALALGIGASGPLARGQGGPPIPPDPIRDLRPTIAEALDFLNLQAQELGFDKTRKDSFVLAAPTKVLGAPLELPRLLSGYRMASLGFVRQPNPFGAYRILTSMAGLPPFPNFPEEAGHPRTAREALLLALGDLDREGAPWQEAARALDWKGTPGKGLLQIFQGIAALRIASDSRWGSPLVGKERNQTLRALPSLWLENFAPGPKGTPLSAPAAAPGAEPEGLPARMQDGLRLDWELLASTGLGGLRRIQAGVILLKKLDPKSLPPRISHPKVEGDLRVYIDTPMGPVAIGGPGPTIYHGDYFFILDLGGDDRYEGRVAAASSAWNRPVSVLLDLGGEDSYISGEPLDQGAALFGTALLWDMGQGRDLYRAGDLSQGAAILGAGILLDEGGRNRFEGGALTQGAAGFGFGILATGRGNDSYDAARFAQGFGGVRGFGALVDIGGNEVYRAGGVYLHKPLFNDRYQSLSQGFGIGERYKDASGGIGLLYDGGGNDVYLCDIYGQGAGYWMGLGALIDESGNDQYVCGQYGQGAGIHLAAGGLWDRGGNDSYTLHHGVGQGGAHDLALGWLLDEGGDDFYQGSGLTQGAAKANGVAFFIDRKGKDAYSGIPFNGHGTQQGYAEDARGYGSIALFLDLGGEDAFTFPPKKRDSLGRAIRRSHGLFWDFVEPKVPSRPTAPSPKKAPASLPNPPPPANAKTYALLYQKARLWQVGDNIPVVARARATLVALGLPAGRWLIQHKLGARHTLDRRALRGVIPKIGASLLPDLRRALKDPSNPDRRWNALDLLGRMKDLAAIPDMLPILSNDPVPGLRRKAAETLGRLQSQKALPGILSLSISKDPADRRAAALALANIPGEESTRMLAGLLRDKSFTVRDPARRALGKHMAEALKLAPQILPQAKAPALREWLLLLQGQKLPKESPLRKTIQTITESKDKIAAALARRLLEN
ncbi:MAG TPA: HEAT repeat domain-containing protein [Planctomycetes bacterium]|nr:HEAT repeat domain-containing protein [Planctomycetota bacterium]